MLPARLLFLIVLQKCAVLRKFCGRLKTSNSPGAGIYSRHSTRHLWEDLVKIRIARLLVAGQMIFARSTLIPSQQGSSSPNRPSYSTKSNGFLKPTGVRWRYLFIESSTPEESFSLTLQARSASVQSGARRLRNAFNRHFLCGVSPHIPVRKSLVGA